MNIHYEKYKEQIKANSKKYLAENQELRLYGSCKANAKKRGIEFNIKVSDIKIPKICPLLGIPITNIMYKGRVASNASLDRIDSSKAYTPDNIQVISDLANRMKQDATPEQLLSFANGVLEVYARGVVTRAKVSRIDYNLSRID